MTKYEQDFIYKTIPNLTKAIDNLSEKIDKLDNDNVKDLNKFYQALDDAGITTEDFIDYIGAILGTNVANTSEEDNKLIKESWDFIQQVYNIAAKSL